MFTMTYNGTTNEAHNLMVSTRPSIPAPQRRETFVTVPGRDGALVETDGAYDPIQIDIALNYTGTSLGDKFRAAKAWLQGSGELSFSDDSSVFYKVISMTVSANNRRALYGADLTATAICEPYTYLVSGKTQITLASNIANNYDVSKPLYEITGTGTCVLKVNGNSLTCTVASNMLIDTDLMLAYKSDGTMQNAATSGANFDDLWLTHGTNTLSKTGGFTVKLKPNWRVL